MANQRVAPLARRRRAVVVQEGELGAAGLDEPGLFQGIVGSDSYSEPKPNRAAFEVALGRAGLSLEEAHRGARAHALAHAVRARGWTLCGHASGGCCNRPPSLAAMC